VGAIGAIGEIDIWWQSYKKKIVLKKEYFSHRFLDGALLQLRLNKLLHC